MASTNSTVVYPASFYTESHSTWVTVPTILFTVLGTTLVGIRFWARRVTSGLGPDDWVCLAAFLFAIATNGLFLAMTHYGFGRHIKSLSADDRTEALFLYWVSQITYKISLQLTKISLLLLYMRIFSHVRWFRRLSLGLITVLVLYGFASCITGLVQCTPVARAWNYAVAGSCIQLMKFFIFNGAFALATDVIVLLLPMPLVWRLQLPLSQKIALIPVFGIGIFIVITSTLRLYALIATPSADTTYELMGTLWTIIEFNLALVCASLPTVRVMLVRMMPGRFGSRATTYGSNEKRSAKNGGVSWGSKTSARDGWSRVGGTAGDEAGPVEGINLTAVSTKSVSRRDETSSEDYIIENPTAVVLPGRGIHKTVQYDVEYGLADAK
ncbi:hypothetical protein B0T19DRAFT_199216 [Cercophora scortea]|uniref:Rhodopsin domain-containing protein n=1 Tax=Cercophora scortea TaxID=314031 RepID=A0AAE0IF87_9PEZI|nr:hypothetical protein B0T19DRAFT_199216 [Cercophora scortea]